MVCANCGDMLPDWALEDVRGGPSFGWCAVEGKCLTCCLDFVGHVTPVRQFEAEFDEWLKGALADAERHVENPPAISPQSFTETEQW